jgi:hypothetical protein
MAANLSNIGMLRLIKVFTTIRSINGVTLMVKSIQLLKKTLAYSTNERDIIVIIYVIYLDIELLLRNVE